MAPTHPCLGCRTQRQNKVKCLLILCLGAYLSTSPNCIGCSDWSSNLARFSWRASLTRTPDQFLMHNLYRTHVQTIEGLLSKLLGPFTSLGSLHLQPTSLCFADSKSLDCTYHGGQSNGRGHFGGLVQATSRLWSYLAPCFSSYGTASSTGVSAAHFCISPPLSL